MSDASAFDRILEAALAAFDRAAGSGLESATIDERALFERFARAFLRGVEPQRGSSPQTFGSLALEAWREARRRKPGELRVRVARPEDSSGVTTLVIVQEDRPFIVDSLRILLDDFGLRERVFLHPVFGLRRDGDGRLTEIDEKAPLESIVGIEAVPDLEDGARARLERELHDMVEDVRAVTDDHARLVREVRGLEANLEFAGRWLEGGAPRAQKIRRFFDWLIDGRFVFLGFRRYRARTFEGGEREVALVPGSGLGLWRRDEESRLREPRRGAAIPHEIIAALDDQRIVVIDKSRLESRIHREGRLDRIVVKEHDEAGNPTGFAIVGGLFTYRALRTPASQIPLLAERLEEIQAEEAAPEGSHRHKAMVAAFDSAPVEFLLGSDLEGVKALIHEIIDAEGSTEVRLVLRGHPSGRSYYAAVLVPRERYGEDLRQRLRDFFAERTGATYVDDRTSFIEEGTAVLHFFGTSRERLAALPDPEALEDEVRELAASWEDRLREALIVVHGEREGAVLAARYEAAFPEAHRLRTHPADAVHDVAAMERLHETGRPQVSVYQDHGQRDGGTTLKIYLTESRLLSDLLPVVDHFGIGVIDAQQGSLVPLGRSPAVVETLRVLPLGESQADLDVVAPRLVEAMRAVLERRVANDPLNALVLIAGLDWREVDLVRAYLEYLMQIQGALARPFVRSVLLENPLAVRLLVRLHAARLDPEIGAEERARAETWLGEAFERYRDRIPSLNEDRALSGLRHLIGATLRTRFFAPPAEPWRVAFKIDPAAIPELTGPLPWREIFVHAAELTGIHLRGGPVARGGLRFSDRADDLRVEVLGLMRTQMLKNGLIVPVGAKGGFVMHRTGLSPRETRELADAQYRVFIASLLDLTDSLAPDGSVLPPPGVHRRDADDPYLVVAADKGTAHLSDAANEISIGRDFWLGDAFASGGSEGYDHKKYGITARGAWECVKHHFAELGIDAERDEITVAGIGDMSGDVFGNGLLLARHAKLLAAFDHRHVFLDPDPDPDRSWQERKRLFETRGSSWSDYDPSLISEGGGVWPRSAKRIELSPRARARLGIEEQEASGNAVVRAILAMPVDLLWNGGIGTYVKARRETHAEADDRANDAVRIDGSALRARVIGEGGNLGLTQAARVEAALAGVKLDTDAIDNSAGVDLSDHEVNFKVLLAPKVRAGALSAEARRNALFAVDDDACERVLDHNRGQALALSLDEWRSQRDLGPFVRALELICAPEDVDREELDLPGPRALERRARDGRGLTRPELAVLLGLVKLQTRQALEASDAVEAPYVTPLFERYFPDALREAHPDALAAHRLRRGITALCWTNRLIEAGGVTLVPSLVTELGIEVPRAMSAVLAAEDVLDAPALRTRLLAAAGSAREAAYAGLVAVDDAVRSVARLLVRSRRELLDAERIEAWRERLQALRSGYEAFLSEGEREAIEARRVAHREQGLPEALAGEIAELPLADRGLNIVRILERVPYDALQAARVYARLGDATGINWVYQRLARGEAGDLWERLVLGDLRWDLLDLQRELTERVLAQGPEDPLAAADAFLEARAERVEQVRALQRRAAEAATPSALAVVTQRLRALRAE